MATEQPTLNGAVTAAAVRGGVLWPAMDAVAANHDQQRLAIRVVQQLKLAHQAIDRAAQLLIDAADANAEELASEQAAAGWADEIVAHLHALERNNGGSAISGRQVARELIPLLDQGDTAGLHDLFGRVPATLIFRPAVMYHVGRRRQPVLQAAHREWGGG